MPQQQNLRGRKNFRRLKAIERMEAKLQNPITDAKNPKDNTNVEAMKITLENTKNKVQGTPEEIRAVKTKIDRSRRGKKGK